MNRTANPEAEMADRVASLLGTALTEADVHRFLLDAASLLGTESFAAYGPDLRFRWRVGERAVEIESYYGSLTGELSLRVNSFNPEYPIDNEYRSFEWVDAADYPYLWTVELGRTPFNDWEPGEAYIVNWDMFEKTTAKVLGGLPGNLALMPPQWRRPFALRWDMGASGLGLISFTGTIEGLRVTVESTGEQVLATALAWIRRKSPSSPPGSRCSSPAVSSAASEAGSACATSSPAWPVGALSWISASLAPRASATTALSPSVPPGTRTIWTRTTSSSFWRIGDGTNPGAR